MAIVALRETYKPLTGLALLLAFALRVYRLDYQSIWWDEGYSIDLASRSLAGMTQATAIDIHPPAYYYLLSFWLPLVGRSEFAVRFLSLITGLLLVALFFKVTQRFLGERVALIAGFLATLSPLYVAYSQEARMYLLETLLGLASVYLLFLLLPGQRRSLPSWALWGLYVISSALSLWVDYFPVLVLFFENLFILGWALLSLLKRANPPLPQGFLLRWAAAQLGVAVLYLPWLGIAWGQVSGYGLGNVTAPSLEEQLTRIWGAFNLGSAYDPTGMAPFLWLIFFLFLAGLILAFLSSSRLTLGRLYLLCYLILTWGGFHLVLLFRPFFHERYFMVVTPAYYILLALGLYLLWQRWRVLAAASTTVLAFSTGFALQSYFFDATFFKDDTRSVVRFLEEEAKEDDLILWQTPHPFDYYYRGAAQAQHHHSDLYTTPEELTRLAKGKMRIFWVTWRHNDTDLWAFVPFLLEKHGQKQGEVGFSGYKVVWYSLPPNTVFSSGDLRPLEVDFEGVVKLLGVALGGKQESLHLESGQRAWVALKWRSLKRTKEDLKFYVHVRDQQGHLVGQDDRMLLNDKGVRTPYWRAEEVTMGFATPLITPGTPPGDYQVEVGVYSETTGRRLGMVRGSGVNIVGALKVGRPAKPPSLASLDMQRRVGQAQAGLEFLGYSWGGDQPTDSIPSLVAKQGESLPLTLFWRAQEKTIQDPLIVLRLLGQDRRGYAEDRRPPLSATYPPSFWEVGEVVREVRDFLVPPETPAGRYQLTLSLEGSGETELALVEVQGRTRRFTPPPIQHEASTKLKEGVELLGFEVTAASAPSDARFLTALKPGGTLKLTLFWKASGPTAKGYTVFTHILDSQNEIWGQKDAIPQGGSAPTTSWMKGEVIIDTYEILLKANASPGEYQIEVGMYDAISGERLALEGGGDRILLGSIEVLP